MKISYGGDFAVVVNEDRGIMVYSNPGRQRIYLPYQSKIVQRADCSCDGNSSTFEDVIRYLATKKANIVNIDRAYISPDGSRLIISGKRASNPIDDHWDFRSKALFTLKELAARVGIMLTSESPDHDIHNAIWEYFVFSI